VDDLRFRHLSTTPRIGLHWFPTPGCPQVDLRSSPRNCFKYHCTARRWGDVCKASGTSETSEENPSLFTIVGRNYSTLVPIPYFLIKLKKIREREKREVLPPAVLAHRLFGLPIPTAMNTGLLLFPSPWISSSPLRALFQELH